MQPLLYNRATTDSVALSDNSLLLIQRTSLEHPTYALHITMFLRGGHRTHMLHTDVAQGLQVLTPVPPESLWSTRTRETIRM
jgi:hypothetical protein